MKVKTKDGYIVASNVRMHEQVVREYRYVYLERLNAAFIVKELNYFITTQDNAWSTYEGNEFEIRFDVNTLITIRRIPNYQFEVLSVRHVNRKIAGGKGK